MSRGAMDRASSADEGSQKEIKTAPRNWSTDRILPNWPKMLKYWEVSHLSTPRPFTQILWVPFLGRSSLRRLSLGRWPLLEPFGLSSTLGSPRSCVPLGLSGRLGGETEGCDALSNSSSSLVVLGVVKVVSPKDSMEKVEMKCVKKKS